MKIDFCVKCFASSLDASWGGDIIENYCMNCGNTDTVKLLPRQVEEIRRNASWVGKRYYPNEEDIVIQQELEVLRPLLPDHVTDRVTVTMSEGQPQMQLTRHYAENTTVTQSRNLPRNYTPQEFLESYASLRKAVTISYEYRRSLTK